MIHPVIMAGGRGERFWPYSNAKHPKQLLPLVTRKSMLEDTIANIRKFSRKAEVRLVIGKNLEKPVKEKLAGAANCTVVAEPMGRNTAAAVALACRLIQAQDPEGVMLVMTADHAIGPAEDFAAAMRAASEVACCGESLVTFGIPPTRPEVGYGYIEVKEGTETVSGLEVRRALRFHEKPSRESAQAYVESNRFFWNSGMFAWRVDYLWEQFRRHMPAMAKAFEAAGNLDPSSPRFQAKLKKLYEPLPDVSIDYGILEKCDRIEVVVPSFSWDDIGAWSSLDRQLTADADGNRLKGDGVLLDCRGNTCFTDNGLVALFGVENLLVVHHEGVTLVVEKSKAAQLKELVKKVRENPKWAEYL